MECYSGEVMNSVREGVLSMAADVEIARDSMVAAGAEWYFVTCLDEQGEKFTQEILAQTPAKAKLIARENPFAVAVLDAITEREAQES